MDDLILINFQRLFFENINTVLNYWPLSKMQEFNTHLIADFLAFQNPGLQLAFPIADIANTSMRERSFSVLPVASSCIEAPGKAD